MTDKKRARDDDGNIVKAVEPDKAEIICPLVFLSTKGQSAVNYDITWAGTIDIGSGPGVWRSAPQKRGHTDAFNAKLKELKDTNQIGWDEKAYYFTHEEGIAAREKYQQLVLDGKVKANKRSWGPNPDKAPDNSRFHKFTDTTFEQLIEKYPELYKAKAKKAEPKETTEEVAEETTEEPVVMEKKPLDLDMDFETSEPNADEILTAEAEMDLEDEIALGEQEDLEDEEAVTIAASTAVEETEDTEVDDNVYMNVRVFSDASETKMASTEAVCWTDDQKKEQRAYLCEVQDMGREFWLPAGKNIIGDPETGNIYYVNVNIAQV